jgi:hypothetical protein
MPSDAARHLEAAAERTFEQLGFLFSLPLDAPPEGPRVGARARIAFRGACQGSLELAVERSVLDDLTRNLLGPEEGMDAAFHAAFDLPSGDDREGEVPLAPGEMAELEALEADCLREAANVICGNVLAALAGDGEPWLLDAPELLPPGDLHASPEADECRVYLEVGEGWAGVRLSFLESAGLLGPRARGEGA